jgi:hypothetical protein
MQGFIEPELPLYLRARVELMHDLTRYHPALKVGTQGIIVSPDSRLGDRFCGVTFQGAGFLDVLCQGLKLVDNEEFRAQNAIYQSDHRKQIEG